MGLGKKRMIKTILDTHALIWWVDDSSKLSKRALQKIEESTLLGISAVPCLEIAMLVAKKNFSSIEVL